MEIIDRLIRIAANMNVMETYDEDDEDVNHVDEYGWARLHNAVLNGNLEECKQLVERGANLNPGTDLGWTPLMFAASEGPIEIVRMLLEAGADPNIQSTDDIDALTLAALSANLEITRILVDAGADRERALIESSYHFYFPAIERLKACKLLLDLDADVSARNSEGRTALMMSNTTELTRLLLEAGSNVNTTDNEGKTALMIATTNEQAKLLIEAGAELDIVDKKGNTAVVYAGERGLWEVVELIMKLNRYQSDQTYRRFLQSSSHFM